MMLTLFELKLPVVIFEPAKCALEPLRKHNLVAPTSNRSMFLEISHYFYNLF